MGMSANQVQLLQLTSRLSDIELQTMQIMNERTNLAKQTSYINDEYTKELKAKRLVLNVGGSISQPQYISLTANMLLEYNENLDAQRMLKNKYGNVAISQDMFEAYMASGATTEGFMKALNKKYEDGTSETLFYEHLLNEIGNCGAYIEDDSNLNNSDWLQEQLKNGGLFLSVYKKDKGNGESGFKNIQWDSGDNLITQVDDDSQIATAKAEHEKKLYKLNNADKMYELEVKKLDTEHSSTKNRMDTIKKLIDENIKSNYNSFG